MIKVMTHWVLAMMSLWLFVFTSWFQNGCCNFSAMSLFWSRKKEEGAHPLHLSRFIREIKPSLDSSQQILEPYCLGLDPDCLSLAAWYWASSLNLSVPQCSHMKNGMLIIHNAYILLHISNATLQTRGAMNSWNVANYLETLLVQVASRELPSRCSLFCPVPFTLFYTINCLS